LKGARILRVNGKARQKCHGVLAGIGAVAKAIHAVQARADQRRVGDDAVVIEIKSRADAGVAGRGIDIGIVDGRITAIEPVVAEQSRVAGEVIGKIIIVVNLVDDQNIRPHFLDDCRRGAQLLVLLARFNTLNFFRGQLPDVKGGHADGRGFFTSNHKHPQHDYDN